MEKGPTTSVASRHDHQHGPVSAEVQERDGWKTRRRGGPRKLWGARAALVSPRRAFDRWAEHSWPSACNDVEAPYLEPQ